MGAIRFALPRSRYQARPGRAALVAEDLDDLQGPVTGTVVLPIWLFLSLRDRQWHLDNPREVCEMYQMVLCAAYRPHDLTSYINGATLVATWPDMFVPKGVRRAWEECHAVLRDSPARWRQ